MKHYNKFHNRIAEINDSIIYHTFCSKQIDIEVELFKKNYTGQKDLKKVTNGQIFKTNNLSYRFNKKTDEISKIIKQSDSFIYDNSLVLIYLQLEIFVKEYYSSIKKMELFFRANKIPIQLDNFKLINSNNIDKLDKKLMQLKENYSKNGIKLTFDKIEPENQKSTETPLLLDINTNQIITQVLMNLGVFNENYEISEFWKKIIDEKKIPLNLYIDTLEYFRLRRNVVAHRELKERTNGSFGNFIQKKGKELNEGWNNIMNQKSRLINFESSKDVVFKNHLEIIEAINILRKIIDKLNYIFSKVYSNKELLIYFYNSFEEQRKVSEKAKLNLYSDFDRFYSKFMGYLKDNLINFDLSKVLIKEYLLELEK